MTTRRFLRDEQAAGAGMGVLVIGVILVGLGLLALLLWFLRREAPGGVVKGAAPVAESAAVEGYAAKVAGSRMCRRCNIAVKPFMRGTAAECPNCGTMLGSA